MDIRLHVLTKIRKEIEKWKYDFSILTEQDLHIPTGDEIGNADMDI